MTQIPPRETPEFDKYKKTVEEAHRNGARIECALKEKEDWEYTGSPSWTWWNTDYRISSLQYQPQSAQNHQQEPSMTPTEQRIVKALDQMMFALCDTSESLRKLLPGLPQAVARRLHGHTDEASKLVSDLVADLPLPSPSEAASEAVAPAVEAGNGGSEDYAWDEVSQQFFKRGEHPIKDRRDAVSAFKSHGLASKPVPLQTQVGGEHYQNFPIQPVEFVTANKLTFLEGCVVKRICRHRRKNGLEDLRKAIHEIELLIELEYGKEQP